MSVIDWIVMFITLLTIVFYGMWKSRGETNIHGFLLANQRLPWYHVGLSVMATQASAITFLAGPGQAFTDGMRFLQFYFGLPLAMIVLCTTFIPIFRRLNVYTAYEYLEKRFDIKTRMLTAFLFLLQRGISTGFTIYAPSIVLSVILGIHITYTTLFIGGVVILYTMYGGTKAVSHTQLFQMCIIFFGLTCAAFMVIKLLPADIGLFDALHIAGRMEKMNIIDTAFDWNNRYNIWSGIIGGFFLQLSYFGTDQSQVGRYLTGESVSHSRIGLIMNGIVKIPMQFFILLLGTLVFVFYQYHQPPVFFNKTEVARLEQGIHAEEFGKLKREYVLVQESKLPALADLKRGLDADDEALITESQNQLLSSENKKKEIRESVTKLMKSTDMSAEVNDTNYVFLSFVMDFLPVGLIGLIVAIIFLASMGSTASGLNSLASTTAVDIYKRLIHREASEKTYLSVSRWATFGWGIFCIIIAVYASQLGNLLEVVNILGSLFYGTILGIFIVAFFMKGVKGTAVFYGAMLAEIFVVIIWKLELTAFLWLNVIGCLMVMVFGWGIEMVRKKRTL